MDKKVRSAIFKQIEKEPFGKKFGLKLIDVRKGYAKVEMRFTQDLENWKTCSVWRTAARFSR
jgi:acyl-coenzyme A thioesterase PaaI-like protein